MILDRDITMRQLIERGNIMKFSNIVLEYLKTIVDYERYVYQLIQDEKYLEAVHFFRAVTWDEKGMCL